MLQIRTTTNVCLSTHFQVRFNVFDRKLDSFPTIAFSSDTKFISFLTIFIMIFIEQPFYTDNFCSVLYCNAFIIYKHHKIKNKRFQFSNSSRHMQTKWKNYVSFSWNDTYEMNDTPSKKKHGMFYTIYYVILRIYQLKSSSN